MNVKKRNKQKSWYCFWSFLSSLINLQMLYIQHENWGETIHEYTHMGKCLLYSQLSVANLLSVQTIATTGTHLSNGGGGHLHEPYNVTLLSFIFLPIKFISFFFLMLCIIILFSIILFRYFESLSLYVQIMIQSGEKNIKKKFYIYNSLHTKEEIYPMTGLHF